MSLIEQHKAFEEAIRADERERIIAKLTAAVMAEQSNNGIALDAGEAIKRQQPRTRKRSVDARITEEHINAVAAALESLPPDPRHNGVKPKQLKHLLPSFGYKTIGACARELAKRGKATIKAGRYQWLVSVGDTEPDGVDRLAEAEA